MQLLACVPEEYWPAGQVDEHELAPCEANMPAGQVTQLVAAARAEYVLAAQFVQLDAETLEYEPEAHTPLTAESPVVKQ